MEAEPFEHRFDDRSTRAMDGGENNAERFRLRHHGRIEHESLQPLHVGLVHFFAETGQRPARRFRHRLVNVRFDRIHLRDNAARMRLDDLRAVIKVNFVAVVMSRDQQWRHWKTNAAAASRNVEKSVNSPIALMHEV